MVAVASLVLAFLFVPFSTNADFEVVPGLAADHAGVYVIEDVSFDQSETSVIIGDELAEATSEWTVHFLLPFDEDVPESRAVFMLGRVDEAEFVVTTPYSMVHAAIPGDDGSGLSVAVPISFPDLVLKNPLNPSGVYTLQVYVYPETKTVENTDPICSDWDYWDSVDYAGYDAFCFPEEPYTEQDFLDWFEWNVLTNQDTYEGEIPETYSPDGFRQLNFDYTAATGPVYQECCSSVVFLPGFKGSVLKRTGNQIWPPSAGSSDIDFLRLTPSGESVYQDILVDGLVSSAYTKSVYSEFINFMNTLVPGTITAWEAFPYDWRFGPEKVIADENMIARLEDVALNNSATGKVTIVAHSMGGLVGKELIKELEAQGKEELVDSFVMLGTPQLGTPLTVASMLHGEGEQLLLGFITDRNDIRNVALNMPSVYSLLPSEEYFNRVTDPVVTFDQDTGFTAVWRNFWGLVLGNFTEYYDFLTGNGLARTQPEYDAYKEPEVLSAAFLDEAHALHSDIDAYEFPSNVHVVQVAGWGLETPKGITYTEDDGELDYKVNYTSEGDNTVVYPSAVSSNGDTYFVNLASFNRFNLFNDGQHRNLSGIGPVKNLLSEVINEESITTVGNVTSLKPPISDSEKKLLVSVHSPVTIGVYDSQGNYTGLEDQEPVPGVQLVSEEIPNSQYVPFGEGKYIFVPDGGEYSFVFGGTGVGAATIQVEKFENDTPTTTAVFSNISVSQDFQATLAVNSSPDLTLDVDSNGDGEVDEVIVSDCSELSLEEVVALLKEKIDGLDVKEKVKKNLLKRVERLEKKIEKKKQRNQKILDKLEKKINKKTEKGKIDIADAGELIAILDELEMQSDEVSLDLALLQELREKIENTDMSFPLKWNLLQRVDKLEKKTVLTNTLSRFTKAVMKKGEKGKIEDEDVQEIINLLGELESRL